MPVEDRKIGLAATAVKTLVASWARTPGSVLRLIGHPLSLPLICESPAGSSGSLPLPRARHERAARSGARQPAPLSWVGRHEGTNVFL